MSAAAILVEERFTFDGKPENPRAPEYAKQQLEDAKEEELAAREDLATKEKAYGDGAIDWQNVLVARERLEQAVLRFDAARTFARQARSKEAKAAQNAAVEAMRQKLADQARAREECQARQARAVDLLLRGFDEAGDLEGVYAALATALATMASRKGVHHVTLAYEIFRRVAHRLMWP